MAPKKLEDLLWQMSGGLQAEMLANLIETLRQWKAKAYNDVWDGYPFTRLKCCDLYTSLDRRFKRFPYVLDYLSGNTVIEMNLVAIYRMIDFYDSSPKSGNVFRDMENLTKTVEAVNEIIEAITKGKNNV